MQACRQKSHQFFFCLRKSLFLSPSLLNDNFIGKKILDWWSFFSQHLKFFILLSSCLHGHWKRYNSCVCFFIGKGLPSPLTSFSIFSLFFLSVVWKRYAEGRFWILYYVFSELFGPMVWFQTLTWGNSTITVFSFFLLWYSYYSSVIPFLVVP